MADVDAQIRCFKASDDKVVRFAIGKASFELLAVANRRAYFHPLTLSAWALLSYAITNYMQSWPTGRHGFLGYLRPLPMIAASAVPVMFLIDWLNRYDFEPLAQEALKGPDMKDIHGYYSKSPASGFWILEYGGLFVGLIGLDATSAPANNATIVKVAEADQPESTALIRHFYIDEAYRKSGIQEDLLAHALQFAFKADPRLRVVRAPDTALVPYVRRCLREAGFVLEKNIRKVGVFRWQLGMRVLNRNDWEKKDK